MHRLVARVFGLLTVSAELLILSGCATPRIYPICNYDGEGGGLSTSRTDVSSFVRGVAGKDAEIEFSPNERYIAVLATSDGHALLSKVWPSAGCLGKSRYDVEYMKFKGCVYMLQRALENDGIAPLGVDSDSLSDDSTFYCGLPLQSESRAK